MKLPSPTYTMATTSTTTTTPSQSQLSSSSSSSLRECYQIDCVAASSGKVVAATKRRVRFRFGFTNPQAQASAEGHGHGHGRQGVECRGSEHEVTFVWSLASGKRLVLLDGKEVHFSKGKSLETTFTTSWTFMPGHHQMKLVADATASGYEAHKHQFNLFVDGMSFFQMPHIYQLGQQQQHQQQPQRRSMRDAAPPAAAPPTMDILSEPMVQESPYDHPHPTAVDHYASDSALSTLGTMSLSSYDEFAPVMPAPPTMTELHQDILGAYGVPPAATAAPPSQSHNNNYTTMAPPPLAITAEGVPHTVQEDTDNISPVSNLSTPSNFSPHYQHSQELREAPAPAAPAPPILQQPSTSVMQPQQQQQQHPYPALTMAPTTTTTPHDPTTTAKSDVDRALHNLVNLEDITQDAEFQKDPQLTMFEKKHPHAHHKKNNKKSVPLPPTSQGNWNLGPKPTLGDIKATSQKKQQVTPPQEIMKQPAFSTTHNAPQQQAGMMVLYGGGSHNGGPPPLTQNIKGSVGMGFGVGAAMNNRNMHYQQPQAPPPQQPYYAY